MKTALYAKVSTERQEHDQTFASQPNALRGWAAAHGPEMKSEHRFVDEGPSGSRLAMRGLDRICIHCCNV